MNENKSCITINCGCCGSENNVSALKYMQMEADDQTNLVTGKKIYFNNSKSFGEFEMTSEGTVIVPPGVYFTFVNCQISPKGTASYLSLRFHDLTNNQDVGSVCSRVSPDLAVHTSCSEGICIVRFTEPVELCINSSYVQGTFNIEDVYGSIIKIADLPSTVAGN